MTESRAVSYPIEYLTLREAADRYHVSVMTLRRRIRTGDLPAVHCGKKLIRIPAQALDEIFTPVPNATWWAP
ncbi:MAG: helix-turn-helix domain-containing protein [Propionibacteriaceae bacterium]